MQTDNRSVVTRNVGGPPTLAAFATLLLRVEAHERAGLNRRCAILAAAAELGVNPGSVLCAVQDMGG